MITPQKKNVLVCGAGGFIGHHLTSKLKTEGAWVRGIDIFNPHFEPTMADDFIVGDLRDPRICQQALDRPFDEVYQLAADMGGAGYIFTGENDADVMHNSALINLNVLQESINVGVKKIFYSSSACVYPEFNQMDSDNPNCTEDTVYPAAPDSEYGWEKLFSERLFFSFQRNYEIEVRVARFHNIFGPLGTWDGGREKAPAAICRKVAAAKNHGEIEIWGDGLQTRSFLFIDECLEAMKRFMDSSFSGPVNIGSEEMVNINQLAQLTSKIAGKDISLKHIPGPLGVRGRKSDNKLIQEKLGWSPSLPLQYGLEITYKWIEQQLQMSKPEID